ncbi:MFS transporter [candidate division WS5 bacterium]|uniref:MFS transporter n=1 Tax=candidate division WS5 bacterium TaxID=2093353 RepID=A0A419DG67_9BACT|nr:MAG: MFS transporter [candidate division WS5 bacterium]
MKYHFNYHLARGKEAELNEMYASISLRQFGLSIIAIFIPIYLYTLDYPIRTILLYFIGVNLFQLVVDFIIGHLVSRVGPKHVMITSYPLLAINLFMLVTLGLYGWPLWLLALSTALSLTTFWIPYHDDFSKAKHRKSAGREVGKFFILIEITGALGPVLGGVIAQKYGVEMGLMTAILIIMVATLPLFLKKNEIAKKRSFSLKNFSFKENYKDMIAYGGLSLEGMVGLLVWPFFLYLYIGNYVKVGSIVTISTIVVIALSIYMGKLIDKYEKDKVMKTGSVVTFFTALTRVGAISSGLAYAIGVVSTLSHITLFMPFYSEFYTHADDEPRIEYVTFMEMTVDIFRAGGLGILYMSTFFLDLRSVFMIGFALAAIGALLTMLITETKRKELGSVKVYKEISRVKA